MPVTVNKQTTWDVTLTDREGGTELNARPTGNAKEIELHLIDPNGSELTTLVVTADDLSKWSTKVLFEMRKHGWEPKR